MRPIQRIISIGFATAAVANDLVGLGHDELNVKTERFGPTGA